LGGLKQFTILGAILAMVGAALIWADHRPGGVSAELALAGLATPREYVTQLPRATQPAPTAQPVLQVYQGADDVKPSGLVTLAQASDPAVQSIFAQRMSDPNNQYIYNFLNSYQPQQAGGGCAAVWEMIPDYKKLPNWLLTPDRPEQIYSKIALNFLAGMLIRNKAVDASGCQNGGISAQNAYVANACGLRVALPAVLEWQNRFNQVILNVAKETGVPAQLMKNIFSRESQFWPGIFANAAEAGLGQLTVSGADTLLMWNTNFYNQFCPQVLIPEACRKGYTNLTVPEQEMLTGALVRMVNATCPNCPGGIDPYMAEFSVRVFAENLVANCEQVGQIIQNVTDREPKVASTYVDLWMMTLVNYHAGPGCLTDAVKEASQRNYDISFDIVGSSLPGYCASAKGYVEEVIYMPEYAPVPTPPANPTPTPTGTPAP
jgi:hypothetical protein